MIGHSKGAENAIICGQTLNHLVDITISSSNHFGGFINNFTYKGKLQNNAVRPDFKGAWHGFELNEEGFYRSELGQAVLFRVVHGLSRYCILDQTSRPDSTKTIT